MFAQRTIAFGCLFVWVGLALGVSLLALATFLDQDDMGRWAIAVLAVSCTYSIHRSIDARDERLRAAFDLGREHERSQGLSAVR